MGNGPISCHFVSSPEDVVGGSVTYQLQRVATLYPQPTRIRIKNYLTEVEPFLTICPDCVDATTDPVWDGTFNYRELSDETAADWYPDSSFDYLAINGKEIDFINVTHAQADTGAQPWCWKIEIWGATPGSDELIWRGYKFTGTSPVGTYFRDPNTPMCADGLCCLHIESF